MSRYSDDQPRAVTRLGLFLAGCLLAATVLEAAPKADLWSKWTAHQPTSTASIDHGAWQTFLDRYVSLGSDGITRVAYGSVSPADRRGLQAYLDALQATPISRHNRDEQLAYWINFYNALTVEVVLDHYPVDSIRDIDISGFFSNGPWDAELATVEGEELSLNDIEHRILRPIWRDPRLHFALNCASLGCPNLPRQAFTAATAAEQLEEGARAFVNHPRGARFDGDELVVSSIYVWYQVDFGDSTGGVLEHLRQYAEGELARRLAGYDGGLDHEYRWELNDRSS